MRDALLVALCLVVILQIVLFTVWLCRGVIGRVNSDTNSSNQWFVGSLLAVPTFIPPLLIAIDGAGAFLGLPFELKNWHALEVLIVSVPFAAILCVMSFRVSPVKVSPFQLNLFRWLGLLSYVLMLLLFMSSMGIGS